MNLSSKIWIAVLAVLIVAVNGLTVFYIIPKDDPTKETATENTSLFGTPSEIVLYKGDKKCIVAPTDKAFQTILVLNEKRASFAEYFITLPTIISEDSENLYLEYHYEDPYSFSFPLQLETQSLQTQKISFALSGNDSSSFTIDTNEGTLSLGTLNIDATLIELAKELLP